MIPAAFVFLSFLLLWILIGSRGVWWVKLAMMVLTLGFSWELGTELNNSKGLPKDVTLQEMHDAQATLYWMRVDEPKYIYMWMRVTGEPERLYRFPYTRGLHQKTQEAQEQIKLTNGPVVVQFSGSPGKKGAGSDHGAGGDQTDNHGSMSRGPGSLFILPPPLAPPKVSNP